MMGLFLADVFMIDHMARSKGNGSHVLDHRILLVSAIIKSIIYINTSISLS